MASPMTDQPGNARDTPCPDTITRQVVDAYTLLADRYNAMAPDKAHNGLYERPASLSLLAARPGERLLDAGCGPGIASEILARLGAQVEGFDVTPRMIELARQRCQGLSATFRVASLGQPMPWLADQAIDRILCSLALDYVAELKPVFTEFARVTRPGGVLVFSMGHPLGDWMHQPSPGGGSYFDRHAFGMDWTGFGEPQPHIVSYRRPLGETLGALIGAGWKLTDFHEPKPLPRMREVDARAYESLSRLPIFMCVRAVREP